MSEIRGTLSSEELVRLINMAGENGDIDAKGPVSWDNADESAGLAKDIAAFANSRNGGILVIGKEETGGAFTLVGVTEEQAATFETTKVAQWVNSRFSPPIRLVCYRQEVDGKQFVVIEVLEFDDVPAICIKSYQSQQKRDHLLREKTIYVRNANAASVPVGTVEELRALIGLATKKKSDEMLGLFHAMLQGRPLLPPLTDEKHFEDEVATVGTALRAGTEEGQGAWFFAFHPAIYDAARWSERNQLEEIVRRHSFRIVQEFPPCYLGTHGRDWGIANDYYGQAWALTRSGLFASRVPFRENRIERPIRPYLEMPTYDSQKLTLDPGKWIEYGMSLRSICEPFLFMSRMASEYDLNETVEYQIVAGPLEGRRFVIYESGMDWYELPCPFGPADPCREHFYRRQSSLSVAELRADWKGECVIAMTDFLGLFPGGRIAEDTLFRWIEDFLTRNTGMQSQMRRI